METLCVTCFVSSYLHKRSWCICILKQNMKLDAGIYMKKVNKYITNYQVKAVPRNLDINILSYLLKLSQCHESIWERYSVKKTQAPLNFFLKSYYYLQKYRSNLSKQGGVS